MRKEPEILMASASDLLLAITIKLNELIMPMKIMTTNKYLAIRVETERLAYTIILQNWKK